MVVTAADLLRAGLSVAVLVLGYGRLSNVLRFLIPGRVRHRALPDAPDGEGPIIRALHREGYRYLGVRQESILGLHRRTARVYAGPDGRVLDLPPSGRLTGAYAMTWFEGDRCALTRCGAGRDVEADRYRSRALTGSVSLSEMLTVHTEVEASVSLGYPAAQVRTLEDRVALARRWYQEHGRRELLAPALVEGTLLLGLLGFGIYLWL